MTAVLVDREDMARKVADARDKLQSWAEEPGYRGVLGRIGIASLCLDEWLAAEVERGTPYHEIVQAVIERSAAGIVARIQPLDPDGREVCLQALDSVIRRGLAQFDACSPEQRSGQSITTHPRQ